MGILMGHKIKLFGGETKQFGENDTRVFDAQKHRWVSLKDKNGNELKRGDTIRHHLGLGSAIYEIMDDDTYFRDIDTDEIKPAIVVRDTRNGKERMFLIDEVNKYFVKQQHPQQEEIQKSIFLTIKKAIGQLNLFGTPKVEAPQLELFEGQEKDFGQNDKRRLVKTPSGKRRWVNADDHNDVNQNKKNITKKKNNNADEILAQLSLFDSGDTRQLELALQDPIASEILDKEIPQYNDNLTLEERVKRYLDEKQNNKQFKDYGERVSGSKKEIYAIKKMQADEYLQKIKSGQIDEATAYKTIDKDKLIPVLDIEKMKQEGKPAGLVYLLINLRDAIIKKPTEYSPQNVRTFIEILPKIFDELDHSKDVYDALDKARNIIIERGRTTQYKNGRFTTNEHYYLKNSDNKVDLMPILGRNFFNLIFNSTDKASKIISEAENNFTRKVTEDMIEEEYKKNLQNNKVWLQEQESKINDEKYLFDVLLRRQTIYYLNKNRSHQQATKKARESLLTLKESDPEKFNSMLEDERQNQLMAYRKLQKQLEENTFENYKKNLPSHLQNKEEDWSFVEEYIKKHSEGQNNSVNTKTESQSQNKKQNGKEKEQENEQESENSNQKKRTPLSHIVRINGREVKDEEITPEHIAKEFGYKSVQLGNYVNDKDAREHIRHFLGAMKDLEDILDLDIKKINQEAGLSIAFGSRGSGKALAHYEAPYKIINVTKTKGDGSVAHEWMHYLDNILSEKLLNRHYKYLSQEINNNVGWSDNKVLEKLYRIISYITDGTRSWGEAQPKAIVEKTINASKSLRYYPLIKDYVESMRKYKTRLGDILQNIEKYQNKDIPQFYFELLMNLENPDLLLKKQDNDSYFYHKDKEVQAIGEKYGNIMNNATNEELKAVLQKLYDNYEKAEIIGGLHFIYSKKWMGGYEKAISDLAKHLGVESIKYKALMRNTTQYYENAKTLGKKYWGQPLELLARAFESYVQDKAQEKQMKNTYLVRDNNVEDVDTGYKNIDLIYPQGEERKSINQKFDEFFYALREMYGKNQNTEGKRVNQTIEIKKSIGAFGKKIKFGEQMNMFNDTPNLVEGQTKEGAEGHQLVFRNHRWHYLSDYYNNDGSSKNDPTSKPAEFSKDPNQMNMFPPADSKPPLEKVKDALQMASELQNQAKIKEWEKEAERYIQLAENQKDWFLNDMDKVARENGLEDVSGRFGKYAVKTMDSMLEKYERNEKRGKAGREMTDVLRTTMVIDHPNQYNDIVKSLAELGYHIYKNDVNNLYQSPQAGYKHIALKIKKGENDPLAKELLLMRPNMLKAKFGLGHGLYDIEKNIVKMLGDINNIQDEKLKNAINKAVNTLKAQMDSYYKLAYEKDLAEEQKGIKAKDHNRYLSESLDANTPTPIVMQDKRKSSKSKSLPEAKVLTMLKSDLKAVWQPIKAKLLASSKDISKSEAIDEIADLIVSSILNPFEKVYRNYMNNKRSLFRALQTKLRKSFNNNNKFLT